MIARAIEIVPLREPHREKASSLLADAFLNEPGAVATLKKGPETRLRILRAHYTDLVNLNLSRRASQCALLNGELVGVMLICAPDEPTTTNAEMLGILMHAIFRVNPATIWRGLINSMDDEKHRPKEPNYYLETLGVSPKTQARGIGSALLSHLVGIADREQVLTYLCTTYPRTVPFYERFGFRIKAETNSLKIPNYHMVREPKAAVKG